MPCPHTNNALLSAIRPENTHKGRLSTAHTDLNLLYWSHEGEV